MSYMVSARELVHLGHPPQCVDAEWELLACLMLRQDFIGSVSPVLSEFSFYRYSSRVIYGAMVALNKKGQGFDYMTLHKLLEPKGKTFTRLWSLADGYEPQPLEYVLMLADRINSMALMREVETTCGAIVNRALKDEALDSVLADGIEVLKRLHEKYKTMLVNGLVAVPREKAFAEPHK